MAPFRWGIIGPGRIARKFAASLPFSKNGVLEAVASRDLERSKAFAAEFGSPLQFGSYGELLDCGKIDAVYIATPHPMHFHSAHQALHAGIPVLVEKPATTSFLQTQELIEEARSRNVFLMEGMWSWFLPHLIQVKKWVIDGLIGDLVHIQADFGYLANRDLGGRLFNPELGGGVAKDIAIYPLALFYKLIGRFNNIQVLGSRALETGVDHHILFQGMGKSGVTFQGKVTFLANTNTIAVIYGTKGRIEIDPQWFRPVSARLILPDAVREISCPQEGFGFQFEADEVEALVRNGAIYSEHWTWEDSLYMAECIELLEQKLP